LDKAIFITATDTGVGKTTISKALAKLLKDKGYKVAYFKPIETGIEKEENTDYYSLLEITKQQDLAVLYKFKNPVAPYTATLLEGIDIDIDLIKKHLENLKNKYDFVIVEGAGGVAVPIKIDYTYLDFIKETKIPVLVVSRSKLGTINHTYLTVKALKDINADIKGIIINEYEGNDISEKTNPEIIEKMTNIPILAICNKSDNPTEECYKKLLNKINI